MSQLSDSLGLETSTKGTKLHDLCLPRIYNKLLNDDFLIGNCLLPQISRKYLNQGIRESFQQIENSWLRLVI